MWLFRPLDSKSQAEFYNDLAEGKETRSLWGMEKRFSPQVAIGSASFKRYFTQRIQERLAPNARVLDLGCGTGMYHPLLAPLCGRTASVADSIDDLNKRSAGGTGLDRPAVDARVFGRVRSPSSWTRPAVASLLTGLWQRATV